MSAQTVKFARVRAHRHPQHSPWGITRHSWLVDGFMVTYRDVRPSRYQAPWPGNVAAHQWGRQWIVSGSVTREA